MCFLEQSKIFIIHYSSINNFTDLVYVCGAVFTAKLQCEEQMERWYIPKNYPKLSASFWEFLATKSQRMHKQGLHYQWSTSHHTTSLWIALRSLPCTLHSFSWTTSDGSTKIPSVSLRLYQSQLGWFIHYIQSQDFTDYLNTSNVETFGGFLKHVIYQALSIFVPTITIKAHHRPKWFTSALQDQLNQLHTLRQRFLSNASPSNQAKLQSAEQNFQLAASDAKHSYENNFINFSTNRNSSIYKYLSFLQITVAYQSQCTITVLLPAPISTRHIFLMNISFSLQQRFFSSLSRLITRR